MRLEKGSLIFKQLRIGYRNKPFYIYKVRTMDRNEKVTKIGKFLRQTGIDELPQVINILRGEMVLVGPRPLTPQDHKQYREFYLPIKPGLTGLWQIHREQLETVRLRDIQYILHRSLWLDLYIILRTLILVFSKQHYKK